MKAPHPESIPELVEHGVSGWAFLASKGQPLICFQLWQLPLPPGLGGSLNCSSMREDVSGGALCTAKQQEAHM